MKAKQLPGGLDEWLKTRTVVIGALNWLKANEKTPRIPAAIKLLPLLKFELRLPGCCARPKSHSR
jgi:hypothetical protein